MLDSFIGTFDAAGLRTLRREDEFTLRPKLDNSGSAFWAILDSNELPRIEQAITMGRRDMALQLLIGIAKFSGPVQS